ncbi:MAG: cysteine-rich CWC family protein [Flavobacteriaceae bacterium]|jgi:hypothetical protein|nr:cysteine-rich CWC family protein [Flavobacteriaceae bacterium]
MSDNRICTHCKTPIVCNVDDIDNCDCTQVTVSNDTRMFLANSFHKCLCNACLKKFDKMLLETKGQDFPKRRSEMVDGLHYYEENGYFVFTELYHLMKGQCCQNGCRHCVYGFKNRFL